MKILFKLLLFKLLDKLKTLKLYITIYLYATVPFFSKKRIKIILVDLTLRLRIKRYNNIRLNNFGIVSIEQVMSLPIRLVNTFPLFVTEIYIPTLRNTYQYINQKDLYFYFVESNIFVSFLRVSNMEENTTRTISLRKALNYIISRIIRFVISTFIDT